MLVWAPKTWRFILLEKRLRINALDHSSMPTNMIMTVILVVCISSYFGHIIYTNNTLLKLKLPEGKTLKPFIRSWGTKFDKNKSCKHLKMQTLKNLNNSKSKWIWALKPSFVPTNMMMVVILMSDGVVDLQPSIISWYTKFDKNGSCENLKSLKI